MTTYISAPPPYVALAQSKIYAAQGGIYALDRHDGRLLQSYPIKGALTCTLDNNALYVNATTSTGQALQAYSLTDGTFLWQHDVHALNAAPLLVNGILYTCDKETGSLCALQAHSGLCLWQYNMGNPLGYPPAVAGGIVYASPMTSSQRSLSLHAVRARHGSRLWQHSITAGNVTSLLVSNGYLYHCTPHACEARQGWDGSLLWQYEYAPYGATINQPVEKDGMVYLGGKIVSPPILQEDILFLCLQSISYPADQPASNQKLYRTLHLCAITTHDGSLIWEQHLPITTMATQGPLGTLSMGPDACIYLSANDGGLYALCTEDGHLLWHFQSTGTQLSMPIYNDGQVFLGSNDGHIYALDSYDGTLDWKSFVSMSIRISIPH